MKTLIILSLLFTTSASARNLLNDYGTDKYAMDIQMGDVKRVRNSIIEYQKREPAMHLAVVGQKSLISIVNQTTQEVERTKVPYWSWYSLFTNITNDTQIDNMFACYDDAVKLLDSSEVDNELDVSFSAAGLRKWQVYVEPRKLRKNRYHIYSVRRGIRAINRHLNIARKSQNTEAVQSLNDLKERVLQKLDGLYGTRDQLLARYKVWKPRRGTWVNMNNNPGECSIEKAHKVAIAPVDFILEKLEAIRRKYSL